MSAPPAVPASFRDLTRAFFSELGRRLVDPLVMSCLVAAGLVLAGFAGIAFAWKGASATLFVPIQMAYVASGAIGGIGMIVLGLGVLHVQGSRVLEARERAQLRDFASESRRFLNALHSLRAKGYDRRTITSLVRAKPKKLAPITIARGTNQTPG
ncbi:MAG: hypothetical protein M3290_08095 [Actinomycetota bacterium]|nr:hypothetical protein [Actinomycetota bacterium]